MRQAASGGVWSSLRCGAYGADGVKVGRLTRLRGVGMSWRLGHNGLGLCVAWSAT